MKREDVSEAIREQRVLVAYCNGSEDSVHFMGVAMGYYDQPVFMLAEANGKEATWAASLTREATPEEAVAYWRDRARKAEARAMEGEDG